jgi:hypothetical protein
MKRFDEGSGIRCPISWQGCHYWQQGLVAKIGTREKWQSTSKAELGLALREFTATTAGQKIVTSRNFFS